MIGDCNGLYNILGTWYSGDGVILLVSLSVWVTFISDMQCMPNPVVLFVSYGATPTVCNIFYSIYLNLFLETFYWFYASHGSDEQYDNFWVVISLASALSHWSDLTGCSFNRFAIVLYNIKRVKVSFMQPVKVNSTCQFVSACEHEPNRQWGGMDEKGLQLYCICLA